MIKKLKRCIFLYKHFKIFLILVPTIFSLISLAVAAFVWIKFSNREIKIIETNDQDKDFIYDKLQIFPHINKYDFYDDLRIYDNKIIIDNNMIAKIINFVINKAQIPYGNVEYNYEQKNSQELKLTFAWSVNEEKEIRKNKLALEITKNNNKDYKFLRDKNKKSLRYSYFFEVF